MLPLHRALELRSKVGWPRLEPESIQIALSGIASCKKPMNPMGLTRAQAGQV